MEFGWAGMVNTLLVLVLVRLAAALVNTLLRHYYRLLWITRLTSEEKGRMRAAARVAMPQILFRTFWKSAVIIGSKREA